MAESNEQQASFWLSHSDPTQSAVHLALHWLAHVYPESEHYLEDTLRQALPYSDDELNNRWRRFLEEKDVDEHVQALSWLSETLSPEQVPFLVASCWRLLLVSHDMPGHVPLALRLMGRILDVPESEILEIGQQVQRETQGDDDDVERAPLLPDDPRYLDRVEWRLYGVSDPVRPRSTEPSSAPQRYWGRYLAVFGLGGVVGAMLVGFLVWGPMQLGRQPVPRMSHLVMSNESNTLSVPAPTPSESSTVPEPAEAPREETPPVIAAPADPVPEVASTETTGTFDETAEPTPADPEPAEPSTVADPAEAGAEPETGEPSEPVDNPEVLMRVTASVLNVRADPSLDAEIVMKLGEGAQVWVDPDLAEGQWEHVRVGDDRGYASGRYMTRADN